MARALQLSSRGPQFKFVTMPIHGFVLGGERACADADHEPLKTEQIGVQSEIKKDVCIIVIG